MAKTYECPKCHGDPKYYRCDVCGGRGWVDKHQWREYWKEQSKPPAAWLEKPGREAAWRR